MGDDNLQRTIKLAVEFFETKNDPDEISVTKEVVSTFLKVHPATLSEKRDKNGPIAWVLVLPPTLRLMEGFVAERINERELLERTSIGASYEAVYRCSAIVLPEHRRNGLARSLKVEAVKSIQSDHPIQEPFYCALPDARDESARPDGRAVCSRRTAL